MKAVKVRKVELGNGRPKIAVPLTGQTPSELLEEVAHISTQNTDLVEWRVDNFENVLNREDVRETSEKLREKLGELPLLATFRTKNEGGQKVLDREQDYFLICQNLIEHCDIDLIDLELFHNQNSVQKMVQIAKKNRIVVIMSNHDFVRTPSKKEIIRRLGMMKDFGADIAKIAVTPNSVEDVLNLLTATNQAKLKLQIPLITMSMGDLGKVSRLAGELFGSCLTFGTVGAASAPGQIESELLKKCLGALKINN